MAEGKGTSQRPIMDAIKERKRRGIGRTLRRDHRLIAKQAGPMAEDSHRDPQRKPSKNLSGVGSAALFAETRAGLHDNIPADVRRPTSCQGDRSKVRQSRATRTIQPRCTDNSCRATHIFWDSDSFNFKVPWSPCGTQQTQPWRSVAQWVRTRRAFLTRRAYHQCWRVRVRFPSRTLDFLL